MTVVRTTTSVGGNLENQILCILMAGRQNPVWKSGTELPQKSQIYYTVLQSHFWVKELKAGLQRHTCISVFTAASFVIDVEEVKEVEVAPMSTDG